MCGILGLLLADPSGFACSEIFEGLNILQHRGQDAAGIVTCGSQGRFYQCKGNGMVRDIFRDYQLRELYGNMAIAHAGSFANSEAQPFYVNSPYGIVFAHNGNLTNTEELHKYLDEIAHRHINTNSDSELLLNIFASYLSRFQKSRATYDDLFKALSSLYKHCQGGYACVAMIAGYGILGFRDPNGIRPLVFGERESKYGKDYLFASESVALDQLGFANYYDVKPGQAIFIEKNKTTESQKHPIVRQVYEQLGYTPDIFEYVYFARPDTVMDGISVYRARLKMGRYLAKTVQERFGKDVANKIDVVVPVPDTSRNAALELAQTLNLNYKEGFIKNRYIGRTFIMPGQQIRKKSVRRKLNVQALEFNEKNVLIVDDSIVRGTTSKEIIQMAKDAGAKKIYFASCAPPIRYPHVYGIDLASRKDLIAHQRTETEIAKEIGADEVIYQTLEDLYKSCQHNSLVSGFETSVFTGEYVTNIDEKYLDYLEKFQENNRTIYEHNVSITNFHGCNINRTLEDISLYNHRNYSSK
ncbi:amidophosphoribosyltransferase [Pneumocystis carinii B80]|uniref:Amidophosphoribosyltransferase n=1 Tax=Pneumocystis carinii (strain B80) TaxID=1408658 RepID=A0A0W4ZGC6_PNEC8|nr:amidophosphoribosyltransferase [Pneumocystis carinii B80]KTW27438.1 amidophosphoribosyltransferase [Pneumocystis carinii B80]